ncbi:lipase/acyltransferase domain-containing protein [Brevibacillus borstelensis]|uniref:lipase/acyltransferase domain-containing protein n=1 Tax=Brevibacillus borstelensis TaxID=45462 RepID=UPI003CEFBD92
MNKRIRIASMLVMVAVLLSSIVPAGIAKERMGQPVGWNEDTGTVAEAEADHPPQETAGDGVESEPDQDGSEVPQIPDVPGDTDVSNETDVRDETDVDETADMPEAPPNLDGENADGEELLEQAELEEADEDFQRRFAGKKKPSESALRRVPATFEVERNDTFAKADWMFAGKNAHGRISTGDDIDTWKIKPAKDGTLTFSLTQVPSNANYHLFVFDDEKREIGRSTKPGQADQKVEEIAVEKNRLYYVQIMGNNGTFDRSSYYLLRGDFYTGEEGKPDEYEPNNTIKDAHPLDNGEIIANLHDRSDVDYYKLTLDLASTIEAKLWDIPEGMDLDLYLFDSNNKQIAFSDRPKNKDEEILFNADPGTYYLKVAASRTSGFKNHSYHLKVTSNTIPVILIPGIGGSRLEAKEKRLTLEAWLSLDNIVFGIRDPRHRMYLPLKPVAKNSVEVESLNKGFTVYPEKEDGGFRAIEYLSYFPVDKVKEETEQYASMVKRLESEGYRKNITMFAMPYDWRYSNKDNAKYLKEKIDEALKASGASQVQLVAHSMGGLLARETLLSNASYQPKVKRIIYMGTPFLGSPRAYQAIQFGYNFGVPFLHEETGKVIAEYAPAVYELLPSPTYFDKAIVLKRDPIYSFTYEDMVTDSRVKIAYTPLVRQAEALHNKWDKRTLRVQQYSIIGTGQKTLLGYEYNTSRNILKPFYDSGEGDGTVPYISAEYGQSDIAKKFYAVAAHAALPKDPLVIEQVVQLLKGVEKIQAGLRKKPQKPDYLYYIISREDGEFPEITFTKSGQTMTILADKKEHWENLQVEYHGNIVVIHVLDLEPLVFEDRLQLRNGMEVSPFLIDTYSSKGNENSDDEEVNEEAEYEEDDKNEEDALKRET